MTAKVTVNTEAPSPYVESTSKLYRFKRRLTYLNALRLLDKYVDKRAKMEMLEVGTGSGFFLHFAQEHFPAARFGGVEYDERLVAVTRTRAQFAEVIQGNAEDFSFGERKFDVAVSFQVIEHLYNPEAMIDNVFRHLRPGGLFLVTTPNLDGLGARTMGDKWHGFRDDHVSLKGKAEWTSLIASRGFECLYSGSTFFSGIPALNTIPLGIVNWLLLLLVGSMRWSKGESYVGVFRKKPNDLQERKAHKSN